jgi:hypothetical protein
MKISTRYFNSTFITILLIIIWDTLKAYLSFSSPLIQLFILTPFILIGLIVNFNTRFVKYFTSFPISFWIIWIIYALINTFIINGFHHHRNQSPLVFISAIIISFLFLIFIVSNKSNTFLLLNLLIWAYFIRLSLSFIFDSSAIIGNDVSDRLGVEFNSNSIANGALFLVVLIALKKIRYLKVNKIDIFIFGIAVLAIFLSASKKVFFSLTFFSLGYLFILRSKKNMKNIFRYLIFGSIIGLLFFISLKYTSVGSRITETFIKTQNADSPEKMFDSRATQFIYGMSIFSENPINGIGLSNFVFISKIPTPLHSEIMVQITECGIIGILLFLLFYGSIIKKLLKIHNEKLIYKKISELHILSIAIMFILFLGMPIYNIPMMWVLIALAIRFIKETKEQSNFQV